MEMHLSMFQAQEISMVEDLAYMGCMEGSQGFMDFMVWEGFIVDYMGICTAFTEAYIHTYGVILFYTANFFGEIPRHGGIFMETYGLIPMPGPLENCF